MISYIKGGIAEKYDGKIIVEAGGIGYELNVSNNTLVSIGEEGEICQIFTYMHVKDDGITLYGFSTIEEKNMFNLFTTVSGIGPKTALAILSGMKLSELVIAIASGDTTSLSRIKGLSKKTAERICLELKDKISPVGVAGDVELVPCNLNNQAIDEAYQVLVSLGINKNEALKLARYHSANVSTAEEIVANVLKNMGS